MEANQRPIGIFDSGVGGLTVAKAICELMPEEDIIYLGDTARLPYGSKSADTVKRYAVNTTAFLLEQNIKALVIACNTASAVALDYLAAHAPVPVIGVIAPGAQAAVAATSSGHVGVIGTVGTVSSGAYQTAIQQRLPSAVIHAKACPLFVPLAEENFLSHPATAMIAHTYLDHFKTEQIDTLLLGCTHYPLLKSVIAQVVEPHVKIVDSAITTAVSLRQLLDGHQLLKNGGKGTHSFFATDVGPRFQEIAALFFGTDFSTLDHIDLVVSKKVTD